MNALLWAPGLVVHYICTLGPRRTFDSSKAGLLWQFVISCPFLVAHPFSYVSRSFQLTRNFKWFNVRLIRVSVLTLGLIESTERILEMDTNFCLLLSELPYLFTTGSLDPPCHPDSSLSSVDSTSSRQQADLAPTGSSVVCYILHHYPLQRHYVCQVLALLLLPVVFPLVTSTISSCRYSMVVAPHVGSLDRALLEPMALLQTQRRWIAGPIGFLWVLERRPRSFCCTCSVGLHTGSKGSVVAERASVDVYKVIANSFGSTSCTRYSEVELGGAGKILLYSVLLWP